MSLVVCDGGTREWFAFHFDCPRCWKRTTWFGYSQLWYGSMSWCGRCGAFKDSDGFVHERRANPGRIDALRARRGFTEWLLAGSPRLGIEEEVGA